MRLFVRMFFICAIITFSLPILLVGQETKPLPTSLLERLQKLEEENLELRKQMLETQKHILVLCQQNQELLKILSLKGMQVNFQEEKM